MQGTGAHNRRAQFAGLFSGGDRRELKRSGEALQLVACQEDFDALFPLLTHRDRLIVMRAADTAEKITRSHPEYLQPHKKALLTLSRGALFCEFKWHIAAMLPRLRLTEREFEYVFERLRGWAEDKGASKIARVWSLQGMFELARVNPGVEEAFWDVVRRIEHEDVPSVRARIRLLRKAYR